MWGHEHSAARTVVLATHSKEEVEALCRHVDVMVDDRMRCLGTSPHFKTRNSSGRLRIAQPLPPHVATADVVAAVRGQVVKAAQKGATARHVAAVVLHELSERIAEVRPDGSRLATCERQGGECVSVYDRSCGRLGR